MIQLVDLCKSFEDKEVLKHIDSTLKPARPISSLGSPVPENSADVVLSVYKGQGLSNNRNHALELAKADLVIFADDDSRLSDEAPAINRKIFSEDPDLDVAFFRASTYTGKMLKQYPEAERQF